MPPKDLKIGIVEQLRLLLGFDLAFCEDWRNYFLLRGISQGTSCSLYANIGKGNPEKNKEITSIITKVPELTPTVSITIHSGLMKSQCATLGKYAATVGTPRAKQHKTIFSGEYSHPAFF